MVLIAVLVGRNERIQVVKVVKPAADGRNRVDTAGSVEIDEILRDKIDERTSKRRGKEYEVLDDPLTPPMKQYVNIRTRGQPPEFQQVGVLTKEAEGSETILALFGRPVYSGSNKWEYYTGTDKLTSVKLPLVNKNKSCSAMMGCDELYSDDTIYIPQYKATFVVTVYDTALF